MGVDSVVYGSLINITKANSQLNTLERNVLIIFLEQHVAQVLNNDIMHP